MPTIFGTQFQFSSKFSVQIVTLKTTDVCGWLALCGVAFEYRVRAFFVAVFVFIFFYGCIPQRIHGAAAKA